MFLLIFILENFILIAILHSFDKTFYIEVYDNCPILSHLNIHLIFKHWILKEPSDSLVEAGCNMLWFRSRHFNLTLLTAK